MRRTGRLFRNSKEQIVVVRGFADIDSSKDGNIEFGDLSYSESEFRILIDKSANQEMMIKRFSAAIDQEGFALTDSEYLAVCIPPIEDLAVGDIVIRIQKRNEDLRITAITRSRGVQELELEKGNKTQSYQY